MKLRTAILLACAASLAVGAWGVFLYGFTVEGLQATVRFSGRLSLAIFSTIFIFHPGRRDTLIGIFSSGYFLIFAIVHGIHLIELLSYVKLSGIQLVPMRLAGGFLAYVMIFLMPWIQRRAEQNKISESRFRKISYVYLFYVWFVFFMTYLARVNGSFPNAGGTYAEHVTLMAFVNILLGVKIVQMVGRKGGGRI